MQLKIPDDWDGKSWRCIQLTIPDSNQWADIFRGFLVTPTRGRAWDINSGNIKAVQAIGWEIWDRNFPFSSCVELPEESPDSQNSNSDLADSWIGGGCEEQEMGCTGIDPRNIKIEAGVLYVRFCGEWEAVGEVPGAISGTTDPATAPVVIVDEENENPDCRKAYVVASAIMEVVNEIDDHKAEVLCAIAVIRNLPHLSLNIEKVLIIQALLLGKSILTGGSAVVESGDEEKIRCWIKGLMSDEYDDPLGIEYQALGPYLFGAFGLEVPRGLMYQNALYAIGSATYRDLVRSAKNLPEEPECCEQTIALPDWTQPGQRDWVQVFDMAELGDRAYWGWAGGVIEGVGIAVAGFNNDCDSGPSIEIETTYGGGGTITDFVIEWESPSLDVQGNTDWHMGVANPGAGDFITGLPGPFPMSPGVYQQEANELSVAVADYANIYISAVVGFGEGACDDQAWETQALRIRRFAYAGTGTNPFL